MFWYQWKTIGHINVFMKSIIPGGKESNLPIDSHLYQQYNIIWNYLS